MPSVTNKVLPLMIMVFVVWWWWLLLLWKPSAHFLLPRIYTYIHAAMVLLGIQFPPSIDCTECI